MKTLLAVLLFSLLVSLSLMAEAQTGTLATKTEAPDKSEPHYIVVYMDEETSWGWLSGETMQATVTLTKKAELFDSIEKILEWMNSGDRGWREEERHAKVKPENLIEVYDLQNEKRIKLKFKSKDRVVAEHIEIREEKWTDTWWEAEQ